ncbi:MAG TPA: tetratricopeptide repeat protein [Bacteroidia bacterium]|nr:tetratricopeptide repeat protein [Bacteroidia bacterium]
MPQKHNAEAVMDIKTFVDAQISSLPDTSKKVFEGLEKNTADTNGINGLVEFFKAQKMIVTASYYFEKKAALINTAQSWLTAGNRYFYGVGYVQEKNQAAALYQNAIRCYEKALEKKPAFTDAKIQLASCYVEGSADPMKGITMLKELEKTDSSNIQVQMVLGNFAVKSGQLDKAEARYLKILKLKPEYLEAYLFLADVYEKKGDKAKTIEILEKYVSLTPDKEIKEQIKVYIEQLKKNNV